MNKVLKLWFLLILLLLSGYSCFAQAEKQLAGKWLTAKGEAQVHIFQQGDKYSGKIVWLKQPADKSGNPRLDSKNSDPDLVRRPLLGTRVLQGFTYKSNAVWAGGTFYDPRTGRTYDCEIRFVNPNQIHVRAFVGISMLGKTEIWSRVR